VQEGDWDETYLCCSENFNTLYRELGRAGEEPMGKRRIEEKRNKGDRLGWAVSSKGGLSSFLEIVE